MQYKELAELYNELESTSKRLEKTYILSNFLKRSKKDDIDKIMLLIEGRVYPKHDERKVGVASRLVIKAINISTGKSTKDIEKAWKSTGDLGTVAQDFTKNKTQNTLFSGSLSIRHVFETLQKLASEQGQGSIDRKLKHIAKLLTSAKPLEAKYIVRTILEDLRIGVGEGSIRDAICWAFFEDKFKFDYNKKDNSFEISEDERVIYNEYLDAIQRAYDMTNDFADVVEAAKKGKIEDLTSLKLKPNKPIKVMLFQKAEDIKDGFKRVGKPAALEYKYDGFRINIHKDNKEIRLYTRRLEDVTRQFPDIIKDLNDHVKAKTYILDAEVIGIDKKTNKWLPFQAISQRIKRKHDIKEAIDNTPVMIHIFDIMLIDDKVTLDLPFSKRRDLLRQNIKEVKDKINLAKEIITDDEKLAQDFYLESLSKGNEGIMMKNLDSPYKPGSRVGYGVKIKQTMETIDAVITGAQWGEGKRTSWLSSFTISIIDKGEFKTIGKVGTGIKEKEELGISFKKLTNLLKPDIISETSKTVKLKPKIVLEIDYEEIQRSTTYSSGFALRFPRVVTIRDDRDPKEITTLSTIKRYYDQQRNRNQDT